MRTPDPHATSQDRSPKPLNPNRLHTGFSEYPGANFPTTGWMPGGAVAFCAVLGLWISGMAVQGSGVRGLGILMYGLGFALMRVRCGVSNGG